MKKVLGEDPHTPLIDDLGPIFGFTVARISVLYSPFLLGLGPIQDSAAYSG